MKGEPCEGCTEPLTFSLTHPFVPPRVTCLLSPSFPRWSPFLTLLRATSEVQESEWLGPGGSCGHEGRRGRSVHRAAGGGTQPWRGKAGGTKGSLCVPGTCLCLEYSWVLEPPGLGMEPRSLLAHSVTRAKSFGASLLPFPHESPASADTWVLSKSWHLSD